MSDEEAIEQAIEKLTQALEAVKKEIAERVRTMPNPPDAADKVMTVSLDRAAVLSRLSEHNIHIPGPENVILRDVDQAIKDEVSENKILRDAADKTVSILEPAIENVAAEILRSSMDLADEDLDDVALDNESGIWAEAMTESGLLETVKKLYDHDYLKPEP